MSSFRKAVPYYRKTGGYWGTDGHWYPGTLTEYQIMASVQPLNTRDLIDATEMQPEGAEYVAMVHLYSDEPLLPEKQATDGRVLQEADIVVWRGSHWKVIRCDAWQNDVINHFKILAREVEPDENSDSDIPA